jgi:hypothetical protein
MAKQQDASKTMWVKGTRKQRRHAGLGQRQGRLRNAGGGGTDLSHSRSRVDVPLDAGEDGAVVSQIGAFLLSAAAPEVARRVRGGLDDSHGGRSSPRGRGVCHSYCGRRQGSMWRADGDSRIVIGMGLV